MERKISCGVIRCIFLLMGIVQAANGREITPEVKIATSPLFNCTEKSRPGDAAINVVSSGAVSISDADSTTRFVYQPSFYPAKWGGGLKKYALSLDANGEIQFTSLPIWDASDFLTGWPQKGPETTPDNRKIYTAQFGKSPATVEFKWDRLAYDQKTALNISPVDGVSDGLGEKRLNYLRGIRGSEQGKSGGIFRARDRILGDIINSNSVYVGRPAQDVSGSAYKKFHDQNKARAKAVYVGSNDGMLHAFDAENGHELFAYIPGILIQALSQLSRADYVHRPYVDGAISVSEALVGGSWKTILASGMGGGAQGVFALDVTNPSEFDKGAGILWEFTDSDDPEVGNQMGAPGIAKFQMGALNGLPVYKYFVVIASGLNSYKEDGANKYEATAMGALFLLSLDKTPSEKWELNRNYFKFHTPPKHPARQNGLSTPAIVIGNNGVARHAYAGDLQGNLWRFDFDGGAAWKNSRNSDKPIFIAMDSQGATQPITTQPKVLFAPGGGYLVLFGTGKYMEEADTVAANFKQQSFYAIHDALRNPNLPIERNQLESRTLIADTAGALKVAGNDFSYGTSAKSKRGWYVDFMESEKTGERSVSNAVSISGKLFFNTLLPGSRGCGSGRSYALDALTGFSEADGLTGHLSTIGMLNSPVFFQTGVDKNAVNKNGKGAVKKKYAVLNFGAGGAEGAMAQSKNGVKDQFSLDVPAKRFSWREISNWQELRDAAYK